RSGGAPDLPAGMTMLDWLRREKQTAAAIDRFWRVVLVSALNEDLDRMDAGYGIMVFWKAFLSNRAAFGVGIPAVPLTDLYAQCAGKIARDEGEVRTRCAATRVYISNGNAAGVETERGTIEADYVVLALPFNQVRRVVPPQLCGEDAFVKL